MAEGWGWDWTSAVPADTKAAVFPRRPGVQQYDLRVMTSPGEGGKSAEFPGFSRLLVRNCFTGIYVGCRFGTSFRRQQHEHSPPVLRPGGLVVTLNGRLGFAVTDREHALGLDARRHQVLAHRQCPA